MEEAIVRYRTVGDLTVTGAVRSEARRHRCGDAGDRGSARVRAWRDQGGRSNLRGRDGGPQARGVLLMARRPAGRERELLRLATAGSVDDGKSTLIGRLLLDTGSLLSRSPRRRLAQATRRTLRRLPTGCAPSASRGSRSTSPIGSSRPRRRSFILADTPGHERYTRNMFTGASTADVAVVLVDARSGVVTQTRRHAHISALLGIEHMVVCVNKMDLVGWDRGAVRGGRRRGPRGRSGASAYQTCP